MVVIRLSRAGAKKRPFYHIVVADRRSKRGGRRIERLGYFNPLATASESRIELDAERVSYWLSQGAIPSSRVAALIKQGARAANA
jgi:small subunit ribosomal protein S16